MKRKTISKYKDWMKTPAFIDFITVGVIAFQAIVLMEALELGKILTETALHKAWPIDKLITVPMIVALAITFYAQNRLKEAKQAAIPLAFLYSAGLILTNTPYLNCLTVPAQY